MQITITKDSILKKYRPYMKRDERYQVFWGGAGSGKSRFLAQKLTKELITTKITLLVIMATYEGMDKKVLQEFLTVFEGYNITAPLVKVKRSPLQVDFYNGSKIIFMGADDEEKLKSISGVDYCWVEEADGITYDYWSQLKLRLRGQGIKKKFFLSFNPTSENSWLKAEFFDNPIPDSFTCHSTYLDNTFLDDEYIQTMKEMKERNPRKYEIYALGKWGKLGKAVYTNWETARIDESDVSHLTLIAGLDFGYTNDPTAFVKSYVDERNKILYIVDGFYETGLLSSDIHKRLERMRMLKTEIVADSASPMTIDELKRLGVRRITGAKKGADSINNGINKLQDYKIIVDERLDWMIDELENYQYQKDKSTGNYINKPIDKFNHALDALRYSIQLIGSENRKLKTFNKSSLGL